MMRNGSKSYTFSILTGGMMRAMGPEDGAKSYTFSILPSETYHK